MDEETFNLSIRKFLKKVGITSQREIEGAVRERLRSSELTGDETVAVTVTLESPELGISHAIEGRIELEKG
jgi:hypothetical protein